MRNEIWKFEIYLSGLVRTPWKIKISAVGCVKTHTTPTHI